MANQALKERIVAVADNLISSGEYILVDSNALRNAGIQEDGRAMVAAMKSLVADGIMYRDENVHGAWFGLVDMGIDEEQETLVADGDLIQGEDGVWSKKEDPKPTKPTGPTQSDRALQNFLTTRSVSKAAMASGLKKAAVRAILDEHDIPYVDPFKDRGTGTRSPDERLADAFLREGSVDKAAMASGMPKEHAIVRLCHLGLMKFQGDPLKGEQAIHKYLQTTDVLKASMASGLKKWDTIAAIATAGYL